MIEELIKNYEEKLKEAKPGSEESENIIEDLKELYSIKAKQLEERSTEATIENKNIDSKCKKATVWTTFGLGILTLGVRLIFDTIQTNKVLEFEKTGSVTSGIGKQIVKLFKN